MPRRLGEWLRLTLVGSVALGVGFVLYSYVRLLFFGASNIALGGPAYFGGAAWLLGLAGFQLGLIAGVVVVTAWYRRRPVSILVNATIAASACVVVDALATFTVP
jgi:hypothetical protein